MFDIISDGINLPEKLRVLSMIFIGSFYILHNKLHRPEPNEDSLYQMPARWTWSIIDYTADPNHFLLPAEEEYDFVRAPTILQAHQA